MECADCLSDILRDLKKALKSEDVRGEVEKIVKKYSRKRKKNQPKGDYLVKAGEAYYIDEEKPKLLYKVFGQIVEHNYRGLCISRAKPENLSVYGKYEHVRFYWLSTMSCRNCISPGDLPKLLARINEFLKEEGRGLVVIDGIDSLIVHNDFNRFIKFIQSAKDSVSASNGILIISLNMGVLGEREKAMLDNELKRISKKR